MDIWIKWATKLSGEEKQDRSLTIKFVAKEKALQYLTATLVFIILVPTLPGTDEMIKAIVAIWAK